jgi:hypothetical protein
MQSTTERRRGRKHESKAFGRLTSITIWEENRKLLSSPSMSNFNFTKFANEQLSAAFGNRETREKIEIIKEVADLKSRLAILEGKLQEIEATEKIKLEIQSQVKMERFAPSYILLKVIRIMAKTDSLGIKRERGSSDYELFPLYKQKLEGVKFDEDNLISTLKNGKIPKNIEEVQEVLKPSFKTENDRETLMDEVRNDPEFLNTISIKEIV